MELLPDIESNDFVYFPKDHMRNRARMHIADKAAPMAKDFQEGWITQPAHC